MGTRLLRSCWLLTVFAGHQGLQAEPIGAAAVGGLGGLVLFGMPVVAALLCAGPWFYLTGRTARGDALTQWILLPIIIVYFGVFGIYVAIAIALFIPQIMNLGRGPTQNGISWSHVFAALFSSWLAYRVAVLAVKMRSFGVEKKQ